MHVQDSGRLHTVLKAIAQLLPAAGERRSLLEPLPSGLLRAGSLHLLHLLHHSLPWSGNFDGSFGLLYQKHTVPLAFKACLSKWFQPYGHHCRPM